MPHPPEGQTPAGAGGRVRLAGLDGLRGLAALSVLLYHVALSCGLTRDAVIAPLLSELKAGVAVFFVISGCVLWLPYAHALDAGRPLPPLSRYASRRARRVLPAYWLALSGLSMLGSSGLVGAQSWRYWGLAQIYSPDTIFGGLQTAWSLNVELSFYLVLPLAAWVLWRVRRPWGGRVSARSQLILLTTIAGASLIWRAALTPAPTGEVAHRGFLTMAALPGFADWFALGMGVAVVVGASRERNPGPPSALRWLLAHPRIGWAMAWTLAVAATLMQPADLFLGLYGPAAHLAIGLAAAVMVVVAALGPAGRVLRSRACVWLGTVSYGIYLWHLIVVEFILGRALKAPTHAQPPLRMLELLATVVPATLACAAASWYAIERPLLRAGRARMGAPAHSAA